MQVLRTLLYPNIPAVLLWWLFEFFPIAGMPHVNIWQWYGICFVLQMCAGLASSVELISVKEDLTEARTDFEHIHRKLNALIDR